MKSLAEIFLLLYQIFMVIMWCKCYDPDLKKELGFIIRIIPIAMFIILGR